MPSTLRDEARVQALFAEACFGGRSEEELVRDRAELLARSGVSEADQAAILAAPAGRLGLYRRLVRNNLLGVTRGMMPRTRARLNALGGRFDASFDRFLAERGPRTHYLRDVPTEFFEWVTPAWRADVSIPPFMADLAALELVEFQIGAAPIPAAVPSLAEVTLERPLVFAAAVRLVEFAFAVHELSGESDARDEPPRRPTRLLVYRDAEHRVRFLELTPLAASILRRLLEGETLGAALGPACADQELTLTDGILADTAKLLADLGERGVLLGARAA